MKTDEILYEVFTKVQDWDGYMDQETKVAFEEWFPSYEGGDDAEAVFLSQRVAARLRAQYRTAAHETRWSRLAVEVAQELEHTVVGRTIMRLMAEIEAEVPVGAQDGERIEGRAHDRVSALLTRWFNQVLIIRDGNEGPFVADDIQPYVEQAPDPEDCAKELLALILHREEPKS